jgi:large subunit ribosomal protein L5
MKIRTDDEVIVISGKDKGKTGKVLRVDRAKGKVYVEGINMVKRHQRGSRLQRGDLRPEGPQADAHPHDAHRAGRAHARHQALRDRTGLDMARLKDRYSEEIRPALIERFGYSTPMQAPRLIKVTLNMGVGEAKQDSKMLDIAQEQLATIAGQKPNIRRAKKSVAAFKLREGMPVGLTVTLRDVRAYEFLDRLVSIAIPRIRDFRGLNPRSFDGRGNYSMGVREQVIFPEIDYDSVDQVRGLDVTLTTSAETDAEAFTLLDALGMPFARDGRPQGYESLNTELATA